ncbi:MAG: ATP-binding protein [Aureliella sp.]
MLWNAVVMLFASLAALWGLREGVRYTLLSELDDDLRDDFREVSLALVNVFEPTSRGFHAQMDRKARGHIQRSWFVQIVDMSAQTSLATTSGSRDNAGDKSVLLTAAEPPSASSAASDAPPAATTSTAIDSAASGPQANGSVPNGPVTNGSVTNGSVTNGSAADRSQLLRGKPRIIWQTFNVPDWSLLKVPPNFDRFTLPDGVATTIDDFRVIEKTVENARSGPVRVRMGASLRSIQHASKITDQLVLLNIFISLVVAPLGGYWLALRATQPLKSMIRTADRLRPQQMEERLPIRHTEDEIDQLSLSFNRLLDRIAEYLTKRQDFLANSAHELRTPLAALRSTAELALNSDRTVDEYRELLESIVSECGNLEQLVNQLLLLSETESAHFETRGEIVDFSKITSDACDMFGAVAESRGVTLATEIAPDVLVDGSRLHLRQLLNNLIDNAIKFIPNEGRVTVELASTAAGQCLKVRDTGVGIAEAELRRMFERFYRGDRARRRSTPTRGTGLGLSICRAIAEAHGGTIAISSQPGVGTEVVVNLPRPCRNIAETTAT